MKIDIAALLNNKYKINNTDPLLEFSVLIPIIEKDNNQYLVFEVRSEHLTQQPNEICFPGGRIEQGESPMEAALRETCEELLITHNQIQVIGALDAVITPWNSIIHPFVGYLEDYADTFNPTEVKETFCIPLSHFLETEPICHFIDVETKPGPDFPYEMVQQGQKYPWRKGRYAVYFYPYEGRNVWGITAKMTYNFISRLKQTLSTQTK